MLRDVLLAPSKTCEYALVGLLSMLFALSFGVEYGIRSDHTVYLLAGLQKADPSFLANDWFASQTVHHHHVFSYLVWALSRTGHAAAASGAIHLLAVSLLAVSVYALLKSLSDHAMLAFGLCLILLHGVCGEHVFTYPFFGPYLLPSTLGAVAFIAGIAALAHAVPNRLWTWGLAGVCFGLSGAIHGTFLFTVPAFLGPVLVFMWMKGRASLKPILVFAVGYLPLVLPMVVWTFSGFVRGEDSGFFNKIWLMRSPHHYVPSTWERLYFMSFAYQLAAGVFALLAYRPVKAGATVVSGACATLTVFLGWFLLAGWPIIPLPASLQTWSLFLGRMASHLALFAMVFLAVALAERIAEADREPSAWRIGRKLLLLFGLGFVHRVKPLTFAGVAAAGAALLGWTCQKMRGNSRGGLLSRSAVLAVATVFLGSWAAARLPASTAWVRPEPTAESDLYRFVHATVPRESVFIVPFDMESFRLHARRAIVVDWKAFPMRARDVAEWYHRCAMVSGVAEPSSLKSVMEGYRTLDAERSQVLAREYGATHLVIETEKHSGDLRGLKQIYSEGGYAVYETGLAVGLPRE